jgi:hypothetical protein
VNIVDFYRGQAPDDRGRTLEQIWSWDDDRLEAVHDYIQELFPLPEPSRFSSRAPLLTAADMAAFRADPALRSHMMQSFRRMLSFYGLVYVEDAPLVRKAAHFSRRAENWLAFGDHNHLRITRIIRSLRYCGLDAPAHAFFTCLESLKKEYGRQIGDDAVAYWKDAATLDPLNAAGLTAGAE